MHTPEKLPASKDGKGSGAVRTPRPSAPSPFVLSPAAAAAGPMTPAAVLTLQRAVGNQIMSGMLGREEHVHGADRGHGVQRRVAVETEAETAEAPADILNAAMGSPSRSIESGTLSKAQSFYQNNRLSRGRVHTGALAQRAVAAFGAEAMTVGEHIFFGAGVEHDTATAFHEYGHLDKNTRGIAETGTAGASGIPVTDPGQHSEREAANDGAAAASGAEVAPSVVAQRAVGQDTATAGGESAAVQRARSSGRRHRHRSSRDDDFAEARASTSYVSAADYGGGQASTSYATTSYSSSPRQYTSSYDDYADARASTSYVPAPSSRGSSPGYDNVYGERSFDHLAANIVTEDTTRQNPPGRRAISQNTAMGGYSARDVLTDAGYTPRGQAAHLHTGAAYSHGDGLEGQTQRSSNLTPGSQATNLDHKRWEDGVERLPEGGSLLDMFGVVVTHTGLTGGGSSGHGYPVHESLQYLMHAPDGNRIAASHDMDLHDYDSAAVRQTRPRDEYPRTQDIRDNMLYNGAHGVMEMISDDSDLDSDYRRSRHRRSRRG